MARYTKKRKLGRGRYKKKGGSRRKVGYVFKSAPARKTKSLKPLNPGATQKKVAPPTPRGTLVPKKGPVAVPRKPVVQTPRNPPIKYNAPNIKPLAGIASPLFNLPTMTKGPYSDIGSYSGKLGNLHPATPKGPYSQAGDKTLTSGVISAAATLLSGHLWGGKTLNDQMLANLPATTNLGHIKPAMKINL